LEVFLDQRTVKFYGTTALAFSPDGRYLAGGGVVFSTPLSKRKGLTAEYRALVVVWDLKSRQAPRRIRSAPFDVYSQVTDVCFDRDANSIFALLEIPSYDRADVLKGWSIQGGTEIRLPIEIPSRAGLGGIASVHGKNGSLRHDSLAIVYLDKAQPVKADTVVRPKDAPDELVIFDLTTRQERARLEITPELANARISGMSPDGTKLCLTVDPPPKQEPSGPAEGRYGLMFWNVDSKVKTWPKQGQWLSGYQGTYSLDGTRIALVAYGVHIWDVAGQNELLPRGRLYGRVDDVRFSPDGSSLAISAYGGVMIWSIASGREIRMPEKCGISFLLQPRRPQAGGDEPEADDPVRSDRGPPETDPGRLGHFELR
jgi:WD40 repeat protein